MKKLKYLFLFLYALLSLFSLYLIFQGDDTNIIGWVTLTIISFPSGLLLNIGFVLVFSFIENPSFIDIASYFITFLTLLSGYYQWFIWFPKKFIQSGKYKDYSLKIIVNTLLALVLLFMVFNSIFFLKYPSNIIWTLIWVVFILLFKYKESYLTK